MASALSVMSQRGAGNNRAADGAAAPARSARVAVRRMVDAADGEGGHAQLGMRAARARRGTTGRRAMDAEDGAPRVQSVWGYWTVFTRLFSNLSNLPPRTHRCTFRSSCAPSRSGYITGALGRVRPVPQMASPRSWRRYSEIRR